MVTHRFAAGRGNFTGQGLSSAAALWASRFPRQPTGTRRDGRKATAARPVRALAAARAARSGPP